MNRKIIMPSVRTNTHHLIKRAMCMLLDCALYVLYILLMASALWLREIHEWLGIAFFALLIIHLVLNRGHIMRFNKKHIVSTCFNGALLICIAGQLISSLVLSRYALGFLPIIFGTSWARPMHMLCSNWGFVLMSVHIGFHMHRLCGLFRCDSKSIKYSKVVRALWLVVAFFGIWSFIQLNEASYLFMQVGFASTNINVPLSYMIIQYVSISVLITGLAHYLVLIVRHFYRACNV